MVRALEHRELRAHRPHPGPHHVRARRPARRGLADQHPARAPAAGGLQPRRAVLRADLVRPAGADRRGHRPRRHPHPGRRPHRRPGHPLLPGVVVARCSARCRRCRSGRRRPLYPRSPYGVAKVYGHWITVNYRESYDLHASSRHPVQPREPPPRARVRDPQDQPRASRRSSSGWPTSCASATSTPQRDWGFAGDYVEAMWLMLQQDEPDDYVVATGETHSVREFCELAFGHVDLDWEKLRRGGRAVHAAGRGRPARRRRRRRPASELGWKPKTTLRRAGDDDGRRRPRAPVAVSSDGIAVTVVYEWRGRFTNDELNRLHAEGFDHRVLDDDWVGSGRAAQPRLGDGPPGRRGWSGS